MPFRKRGGIGARTYACAHLPSPFAIKVALKNSILTSPARSPVFSHLNATVLGLATVRSFGAENLLGAEFDRHQDLHSGSWYLFITCSRAFGYFLDVICLLFIICVTFSCLMKAGKYFMNYYYYYFFVFVNVYLSLINVIGVQPC